MKPFEPGQILGQRYQLVRVVAVGTFGTVWHAEHLVLRSPVALKVLNPLSSKGEARQRFITEALAAAALRSPHVIQILDCGVEDETPYIVMELLEGESLAERLGRVSRLDAVETSRVVRHIARAIDRAHGAGIVHRDLKPGNVFIQANDGDEIIKVLDFGVARTSQASFEASSVALTPPGVILGTPHYMSPEQASGAVELDFRTDIWSLGVIAYECLVGSPPHDGATVHEVLAAILSDTPVKPSERADVPSGFDAWFARACAYDASARFESGKQAADQFLAMCGVAPSATAEDAPLAPLPFHAGRAQTSRASLASSALALDGRRGEANANRIPGAIRLPVGRARVAWAAALGAGLVGVGWLLLDGRFDDVAATPSPRSAIAIASAHLEASPVPASRSEPPPNEPRPNEPRDAERVTPVQNGAPAPSVPQHPSNAGRATPAASGEASARSLAPSTSARRPKRPASAQPSAKRSKAQLARYCREPWYYDDQGLPQAKSECL